MDIASKGKHKAQLNMIADDDQWASEHKSHD